MGIVMANRQIYSSQALYRFKEDLAVLLISGVFIILSATLDWETVQQFRPQFIIFLILLLFVVRPLSVLLALLFSSCRGASACLSPGSPRAASSPWPSPACSPSGWSITDSPAPRRSCRSAFAVVIATIFAHGFSAVLGRRAAWAFQ